MRLLVKHFDSTKPPPTCVERASFYLVNPNTIDRGALPVPSATPGLMIACHLGGLRMANAYDGPALYDGPGLMRTDDGAVVFHKGYTQTFGNEYRFVDFRCDNPAAPPPAIVERVRLWAERLARPAYQAIDLVFNDVFGPWLPGVGVGWEVDVYNMRPSAPAWTRPANASGLPDPAAFDAWAMNALDYARRETGKGVVSNDDGHAVYSRMGGSMLEGAFHWLGGPDASRIPPSMWERQSAALSAPHGPGHLLVLTETRGDGDWRGRLRFALASTLVSMFWPNRWHFGFHARQQNGGQAAWHEAEFAAVDALGAPLGPKTIVRSAVTGSATGYRREFENGCVVVNPSAVNIASPAWAATGRPWGEAGGGRQMVRAGEGIVVLR